MKLYKKERDYHHQISGDLLPLGEGIIVEDMYFGDTKTSGGILLVDDDATGHGIKPRWAKIRSIGDRYEGELEVGNWILVDHGRWSRGVKVEDGKTIRLVDNKDILLVSEEQPKL